MKLMSGIVIGIVIGIAIIIFSYMYIGGITSGGASVLGKAEPINPVASSSQNTQSNQKATSNGSNVSGSTSTNNISENNNTTNSSVTSNKNSVESEEDPTNNIQLTNGIVSSSNSNSANFDALLKGPYINGIIGGNSPVLISLNHPTINNGVMTLQEYYPMVPSEVFQLEVVSPKPDQFVMYEYYKGKHTGTYNVILNGRTLSGTFINETDKVVSQVTLNIYGSVGNYIGSTPFMKGNIGTTPVVICTGNLNNMTEFYPSDIKSVFKVAQNYNSENQGNGNIVLDESYNGTLTGIYNGKFNSTGGLTGIYTKVSNDEKIPFTLYPSYSN
ncbi:hypothetical protein [Clostridium massiliamazoniense]|uniref:hypothetical protein n=1 Tax=Clostridium massiliamazoniense TaxID=1347366 RepID=UPI0006D76BB0|nr:hypothetical protein [Clostridium massiliamazoniense]